MGSNRREPWVLVHAPSSGHGQQQLSQAGAGSGALGISGVQTQFKLHFLDIPVFVRLLPTSSRALTGEDSVTKILFLG